MQKNQYDEIIRLQKSLPSMDIVKEAYDSLQAEKKAFSMVVSDVAYEPEKDIVRLLQERTGIKNITLLKTSERDEISIKINGEFQDEILSLDRTCRCILVSAEGFEKPFLGIRGTKVDSISDDSLFKSNLVDDLKLALDRNYNDWEIVKHTERFIADAISESLISASTPVCVTGHSLAGTVAKIIAAKHKEYESISYDSPELGPDGVNRLKQEKYCDQSKMYTTQFSWNKINTCWPNQLGTFDRIILSPEIRADFISKGFGYVKLSEGRIYDVFGEVVLKPEEISTTHLRSLGAMHSISDNLAALSAGKAYLIRERNHYDSIPTTVSDAYLSSLTGVRSFLETRTSGFYTKDPAVASTQLDSAYANLSQTIQTQTNQTVEAFHNAEKRVVDKTLVLENGAMTTREVLDAIFEGTRDSALSPAVQAEKIEAFIHTKERESLHPVLLTGATEDESNVPTNSWLEAQVEFENITDKTLQINSLTQAPPTFARPSFAEMLSNAGFSLSVTSDNGAFLVTLKWTNNLNNHKPLPTLPNYGRYNYESYGVIKKADKEAIKEVKQLFKLMKKGVDTSDDLITALNIIDTSHQISTEHKILLRKLILLPSQWAIVSETAFLGGDQRGLSELIRKPLDEKLRAALLREKSEKESYDYITEQTKHEIAECERRYEGDIGQLLGRYIDSNIQFNNNEKSVIYPPKQASQQALADIKYDMDTKAVIKVYEELLEKVGTRRARTKQKNQIELDDYVAAQGKKFPILMMLNINYLLSTNQFDKAISNATAYNNIDVALSTVNWLQTHDRGNDAIVLMHVLAKNNLSNPDPLLASNIAYLYAKNKDFDNAAIQLSLALSIALLEKPGEFTAFIQNTLALFGDEINDLQKNGNAPKAQDLCTALVTRVGTQAQENIYPFMLWLKCEQGNYLDVMALLEHSPLEFQHNKKTKTVEIGRAFINNEIIRLKEERQYQKAAELCDRFLATLNSEEDILKYIHCLANCYIEGGLPEEAITKLKIHLEQAKSGSAVHQKISDLLENTVSLVHIEPIKDALRKFDLGKVLLLEQNLKDTTHEKAKQFCAESRSLLAHYYTALVVDGLSGFASQYARTIKNDQDRFAAMVTLGTLQVGGKIWSELNRFCINIKNDTDFSGGNLLRNPGTYYLIAAVLNTVKQYHAGTVKAKGNELGYARIDLGATLFDCVGLGFNVTYLRQQQKKLEKITDIDKLAKAQWQWDLQAVGTGLHATRILLDFVITADDILEWYNPGASFKLRDEKYVIPLTKIGLQSAPNFVTAIGSTGIDFYLYSGAGLVQLIGGLSEYYEPTEQELIKRGKYLPDDHTISINGALKATRKALIGLTPAQWLATTVNVPVAIGTATAGWVCLYANTQTDINTLNTYINSMIAANGYVFKQTAAPDQVESHSLYVYANDKKEIFEQVHYSSRMPVKPETIIRDEILALDDFMLDNLIIVPPPKLLPLLPSIIPTFIGTDPITQAANSTVLATNTAILLDDYFHREQREKEAKDKTLEIATGKYQNIAKKLQNNILLSQQEITELMRMASRKGHCTLNQRNFTLAAAKILRYMQRTSKTTETDLQVTYNSFRMSSLQSEINALMKNAQDTAAIGRHWEASQLYASLAAILNFNPLLANYCNRMRYFSLFRLAFDEGFLEQAENYLLVIQKLDFIEHSLSHNFYSMSKIDAETDKKPQPGSIYFRLENNRLFYRTCFSDKEEEIFKNDRIAAGMSDQIKIPAGSDLCEALISYKDIILKVILRKGHTHLSEENELILLRDLLQVYLAQSEEYLKESKEDKYKITIKKAKEAYNSIKNLLKKMPEEEHKPLRAFIESQKENKIFSQAPGDEEVTDPTLGLVSVISLMPRLLRKEGCRAETNHTYSTSPIFYSSYMRIFSYMFRPTYQARKDVTNVYNHARIFQGYKSFIGRKTGVLGLGVSVAGTLFYAGYRTHRAGNAESKPVVPKKINKD